MTLTASAAGRPAVAIDIASAGRGLDRLRIMQLPRGAYRLRGAERAGGAHVVLYPVAGSARIEQAHRHTDLEAGAFLVLAATAGEPATVRVKGRMLALVTPDAAAGVYLAPLSRAAGSVIRAEQGAPSLVKHLLDGLAAQSDAAMSELPFRLAQHLIGMIGLVCADICHGAGDGLAPLLRDAQEYIERHLGDIDLTPDRVAAAHNVSTRTLHRVFEGADLTISGWIRSRRLEHCRLDLADPLSADISVGAIGARWGLWDAAHFSRLFKLAFGTSPRAYRDGTRGGASSTAVSASA